MRYEVVFEGQIVSTKHEKLTREAVDGFVDLFVAELERIGAEDIDVSTDVSTGCITASVTTEADDLPSAQVSGGGTIRTAFHAAGAATPGWSVHWTKAKTVPEEDSHPEVEWDFAGA